MNASLSDPPCWSRFQFGFTVVYHYLFPQLTMGLAWFLVYWRCHRQIACNAAVHPVADIVQCGLPVTNV